MQVPDTTAATAADRVQASPLLGEPPVAPDRLPLPVPVDVRSASLSLLALIATRFALHVAGAIFIPQLPGLVLSYALGPLGRPA